MDPDRKGAPLKVKCNSSDLFTKNHIKEIGNSINNMQGEIINRAEFKSWDTYLHPLFYHVEDIVAFKLMVLSNQSLSTGNVLAKFTSKEDEPFQEIKFLKEKNWSEYLKNNSLSAEYDSQIQLTAKKLRNIQTLLKYVPEEFLQEYEFAIPNHSSVAETELAATTSAIQAINLKEKNTPTVTEIEDASTTQIKQAVPLLVQTLKDITENKIKSVPKAANPKKRNSTKRNKNSKISDFIDDELISAADENTSSSEEEIITDSLIENDKADDSEDVDTSATGKDNPARNTSSYSAEDLDEEDDEIEIKRKSAPSSTITNPRKRKIADISEDIPKHEEIIGYKNKAGPSIWKKTKMDIEYLNSMDHRVLRSSNVGTS